MSTQIWTEADCRARGVKLCIVSDSRIAILLLICNQFILHSAPTYPMEGNITYTIESNE